MDILSIKSVAGNGTLEGLAAGYVDLVDEAGQQQQLRFHLQTASELIAALAQSSQAITAEMAKRGEMVGEQVIAKEVKQYDFAHDPQAQVAVMTVRFVDNTALPVQFNKQDLKAVIAQLGAMLATLEETAPPAVH